jgi:N utilization substance protein B
VTKDAERAEPGRAPRGGSARSRARQVALQVLYAIDLGGERPRHDLDAADAAAARAAGEAPAAGRASREARPAADPEAVFESIALHFEMPGGARSFARELALGARAKLDAIDARIAAHSRNWRLVRMAAVDRNILRLATYELGETDTPVAVVIDEAVGLARRYGGDASPAFVNGILDAIARELRGRGDEQA